MIGCRRLGSLLVLNRYARLRAEFSQTAVPRSSYEPNAPLELDPSLQNLLKDADVSLLKHKLRFSHSSHSRIPQELEVLESEDSSLKDEAAEEDSSDFLGTPQRKSPRAAFGSQSIGSVFLPADLQTAIERVINDRDKPILRNDAKRLFLDEESEKSQLWHTNYEAQYKSRQQAARHADRDGTAFASVALPAHYSAVYAVLRHLKHRLGKDWDVKHVIDWGSGVGSGLWASLHSFQIEKPEIDGSQPEEARLTTSSISSYHSLEKRDGLSSIAKELVKGIDLGETKTWWHRALADSERIRRSEGSDALALSAFHLSSLPNAVARKELVKTMWSSGAGVIVLIDHDSPAGFDAIAEARAYLLRMGQKEFEDPSVEDASIKGCHVVAPCPHDGDCPLHSPCSKTLICSFSQRLQRPAFLRKTKHVRAGHEDMGYSYVVIRRGERPRVALPPEDINLEQEPPTNSNDSETLIRQEAYRWPRVVFPPLKKSGHVILDSCTPEGKIMRLTIPRSQGKQEYYDARKSSWGDIFPHEPKNAPQIRHQPDGGKRSVRANLEGSDIGKRGTRLRKVQTSSYDRLTSELKDEKKERRRRWSREAQEEEIV